MAIHRLFDGLTETFRALIERASACQGSLEARPADGGWTAREVLEHVALTDRYLLILVDKIAVRTRSRLARGDTWPAHPPRFDHIQGLATRARRWDAPEHMLPSGSVDAAEVARQLASDRDRCVALLREFPHGEGTLHRIRMSMVDPDDDRLDLYQYLEIVRLHALRHVAQIERARD